ncbi:MAG: PEP-CTERM sorting domain-containing protein [Pirellulales bacterium]
MIRIHAFVCRMSRYWLAWGALFLGMFLTQSSVWGANYHYQLTGTVTDVQVAGFPLPDPINVGDQLDVDIRFSADTLVDLNPDASIGAFMVDVPTNQLQMMATFSSGTVVYNTSQAFLVISTLSGLPSPQLDLSAVSFTNDVTGVGGDMAFDLAEPTPGIIISEAPPLTLDGSQLSGRGLAFLVGGAVGQTSVTAAMRAVPEPATWLGMCWSAPLMLGLLRRRK